MRLNINLYRNNVSIGIRYTHFIRQINLILSIKGDNVGFILSSCHTAV